MDHGQLHHAVVSRFEVEGHRRAGLGGQTGEGLLVDTVRGGPFGCEGVPGVTPEGLDLPKLLDVIDAEMKDAPERLQWAMNHCLAQIGIEHAEHRAYAIEIGERLEVLKDYPTPPNCTSPFAPVWISEMVRRQRDT